MPPPKPPQRGDERRRPPSAKPAIPPMRHPKNRGRWGAGCGVGWAIPRDGVAGLAGATGGGRAGAEYEREPRLPPPPARAQTAPASIKSHETSASTIRVSGTRDLMASPPHSF